MIDARMQGLQTIGLSAVQTGMDNVRNMTGSPIAGLDPHELIDVRPLNYGAQHVPRMPLSVPAAIIHRAVLSMQHNRQRLSLA